MNKNFEIPYNINDWIWIVEDYNEFHENGQPYRTRYGSTITIVKYCVEGYIVDKDGVHIAEDGWDGWNKLETYRQLSLEEKHGNIKVFGNYDDALDFVIAKLQEGD